MAPLVSIVIPTYNRARDLERALKSVISQTYSHWEVLIVDNHSSDDTDYVVNDFNEARIQILKIHNEGVIAASRNLGIKHARGEYVAFLDSDDWWAPRKLEESMKYLEQGADVVYHDLYVATKPNQKRFWRKDCARGLCIPAFMDLMANGNALKNSSVVVRKRILREINGLSEDVALIAMEDFDAWLRAARITENFKRIPEALGYYWAGGGNTSSPERSIRNLEAFEKRYSNELERLRFSTNFWWFQYARGRAYYLMGCHARARAALKKLYWRQMPMLVAAKALWMRLMIGLLRNSEIAPSDR